jgi:hypothetical protein
MLDVLVTCLRHGDSLSQFPQVRGYYLARHLARAGLRAEFRHLPQPGLKCKVLISSEYECEMDWFERHLARPFGAISAERWFCLVDEPPCGRPDHFAHDVHRWFAARGGILCHMADSALAPSEHWIGLGIDSDVVRPAVGLQRDQVLFDFPKSNTKDAATTFNIATLPILRQHLPGYRLIGSGPADTAIRPAFDGWIAYGQPHAEYVTAAFAQAVAVVPGCVESMGMALAEAQVAGACVVSSPGQVKDGLIVPEATVGYTPGEATSLAQALRAARGRDAARIREQACARFDFAKVVARTRAAIGL